MKQSFCLPFAGSSCVKSKEYFFAFTKDFVMRSNATTTNYTSEVDSSIASVPNVSRFLFSIVPLAAIIRTIVSWVDAGKFVEFINNWQYIEQEFENVFRNQQQCGDKNGPEPLVFVDLTLWRNKFLMFYVAIPSLLCVPVYMGGNVHFDEVTEALLVGACSLHFIVFPLVDDTRTCFAHRVIAEAFHQTKVQIQGCIKSGRLEFQTVSAWREFIDLVRSQCSLWGQVESKNQLSATAMAIASTTAVVFIIVHGDYEKQRSFNVILILASYALFQFLQLASKSSTAELITARENEIAKLMVNIKGDATDAITFVEVKFIHDMILLAPSKVLLGNCVMLNKGLMISVYSQVATYIVVLLQLKKQ